MYTGNAHRQGEREDAAAAEAAGRGGEDLRQPSGFVGGGAAAQGAGGQGVGARSP